MSTNNTAKITSITPTTPEVDFEALIQVDAHDIFPEVITEPGKMSVVMRENRHPSCIESNPNYIPDVEVFTQVMLWWLAPNCPISLGLVGETGTGKTELLLYIADRLNEPVYIESITTGMRGEHIEGGYELMSDEHGNNVTQKRYSQAAQGYINGGLVILDEVDKANEDLSTTIHLFLEGKPWTLSAFGETHLKHESCRIAATANTTGEGGHERYITSNKLDAAVRGRLGWIKTHYPDQTREMEILQNQYENLPYGLVHLMVKTANSLRVALLGPEGNGDGEINCPFSTRNLVNWGYFCLIYGLERTPRQSFEFCFLGSIDEDDIGDVNAILQSVWGDKIDQPVSFFIEEENAGPK